MSQEAWAILGVGVVLVSFLWDITNKLQRLIEIAHRIRINDRERDF